MYDTDLFMAIVAGYVERRELYGIPLIEVSSSLDQETANLKEIEEYLNVIHPNRALKILTSKKFLLLWEMITYLGDFTPRDNYTPQNFSLLHMHITI